jgi:hypothetical protein
VHNYGMFININKFTVHSSRIGINSVHDEGVG